MPNSRRWLGSVILASAGVFLAAQHVLAEPPKQDAKARVAALILDLDSDTFAKRESASAELLRLGEVSLPALKAALEHPASPEVRSRAEYLVHEITVWGGQHHEIRLADILEQVKLANRAADPATACNDGKLEKLLDQCVRVLDAAADRMDLKLPVNFKDVRYTAYNAQDRHGGVVFQNNALLILKRGSFVQARHCIILADEQVEVSGADDCIIVARVAVRTNNCHNCVVIAGVMLNVSIDDGSVLLSGSQAQFGIITRSICSTADRLQQGISNDVTFVNSNAPIEQFQRPGRASRNVQLPELNLTNPMTKNSLAERVHVTESLAEREGIALFRLKDGTGEYVARYGKEIDDPKGKPIAALKGWTLCYAGRGLAVFTDGNEFASLPSDP